MEECRLDILLSFSDALPPSSRTLLLPTTYLIWTLMRTGGLGKTLLPPTSPHRKLITRMNVRVSQGTPFLTFLGHTGNTNSQPWVSISTLLNL